MVPDTVTTQEAFGSCLENFYISYEAAACTRSTKSDIDCSESVRHLIECLFALEEICDSSCDASCEVLAACRKKAVALIRAPYADAVRTLITASKKRLAIKSCMTQNESGQNRHLSALIELFGSWSNIVQEIRHLGPLSDVTLLSITSSLHDRVCEASLSCFEAFCSDNRIVTSASQSKFAESSSLHVLDSVLTTLTAMLAVVQHYRDFYSITTHTSAQALGPELSQWRRADGVYVSLEISYCRRALAECLSQSVSELLLLQDDDDDDDEVLVAQAVEDAFFVLTKVVERALSTLHRVNVVSICSMVLDVVRPSDDDNDNHYADDADVSFSSNNNSMSSVSLSALATRRHLYRGVCASFKRRCPLKAHDVHHDDGDRECDRDALLSDRADKTSMTSESGHVDCGGQKEDCGHHDDADIDVLMLKSSSSSSSSGLDLAAAVGAQLAMGVNEWLSGGGGLDSDGRGRGHDHDHAELRTESSCTSSASSSSSSSGLLWSLSSLVSGEIIKHTTSSLDLASEIIRRAGSAGAGAGASSSSLC